MAYSKGSTVAALDFNSLVGFDPTTTRNTLNSVWGTGSGSLGYGQTPVAALAEGQTISASNWATLINSAGYAAVHQGTALAVMAPPTIGQVVTQDPALLDSIANIYNNRFNAAVQGTTVPTTTTNMSTWTDAITFEHVITFSSGDAARYFFNMGGQIALTFGSPSGFGINQLLSKLAMDCGTLVISAPDNGQAKIAGVMYDGFTKIGGSVTAPIEIARYQSIIDNTGNLVPTLGYYGMSTSYQEAFKKTVGGFPSRYSFYEGSYVSVSVKSNGTQGLYGDNGSVISIKTIWEQVPNGLAVSSGTTTTVTVKPPFLGAGITKSWGTPVVTGSVSGS
jgi:hypothetical protein